MRVGAFHPLGTNDIVINRRLLGSVGNLKQKSNIFRPFYQVFHNKKNRQGIGIGLSIVKNITRDVKGSIEVDSRENEGTQFTVRLNRSTDTEEPVSSVEPSEPVDTSTQMKIKKEPFDKEKQTILFVEDNVELLVVLQEEFLSEYNVFTALNGREALEILLQLGERQTEAEELILRATQTFDDIATTDSLVQAVYRLKSGMIAP